MQIAEIDVNTQTNSALRTRLLDMNLDGSMTCTKGQVSQLLGITDRTFDRIRANLKNFPSKIPGLERWSRPAVVAWIRSNGETASPGAADIAEIQADLESHYGAAA